MKANPTELREIETDFLGIVLSAGLLHHSFLNKPRDHLRYRPFCHPHSLSQLSHVDPSVLPDRLDCVDLAAIQCNPRTVFPGSLLYCDQLGQDSVQDTQELLKRAVNAVHSVMV